MYPDRPSHTFPRICVNISGGSSYKAISSKSKEAAEALNRSRVSSQLPILEIAKDFLTKHVQAAGKLRA